jgi:hypothetical protein
MEQLKRPMIPPDYEKGIRRAFLQVLVLCLCAVVPPLFSLTGIFAPEDDQLGQWFQRSGAVMTAFAGTRHLDMGLWGFALPRATRRRTECDRLVRIWCVRTVYNSAPTH